MNEKYVIVVFTGLDWCIDSNHTIEHKLGQNYSGGGIICLKNSEENIILILHPETEEAEKLFDNKVISENLLQELRKYKQNGSEIIFAIHRNDQKKDKIKKSSQEFPIFEYSHEPKDPVWQPIKDAILAYNTPDFDNKLKHLKEILKTPWRLEYFLELSLRLLALTKENKEAVKAVIQRYEKDCNLNEEEKDKFEKIKLSVDSVQEDKDILDPEYRRMYKEVYNKLRELAQDEINRF